MSGWRAAFPPAQWVPAYQAKWLPKDAVAGVTLAAYGIPVSLAYASLAGLPPQYGIYCYLVGGLFYALFGSSRQLAIGPTSAISMLVGVTVAGMAEGDPARWASIAALTAVVIAAMCLLAWLLRLSSLVNFISETILLGFKAGAALTIAMTQLPKLFGVKGGGEHFFERIVILGGQLPDTNLAVFAFGLAALALLLLGEKFLPGRPIALFVVVASIVVLSVTPLAGPGLQHRRRAAAGPARFQAAGTAGARRGRRDSARVRLPAARLRGKRVGGARPRAAERLRDQPAPGAARPGRGQPGRGLLPGLPGRRRPVAVLGERQGRRPDSARAGVLLGHDRPVLLYLTGLLSNLPNVVLAAIVLVAVKGLINVRELRHVWRVSRFEFLVSMIAFVGVLLLGILKGVMLAVVMTMLLMIRRAAHPHVAFLGRIPGTRGFSDMERNPDNEATPGVLVFRVEASLLYFNVEHVRDAVWQKIRSAPGPLKLVVCDLSISPVVDLAGARMLAKLHEALKAQGVRLRLVAAHASVRDILRAEGLEDRIGYFGRRISVADAIDEFQGGALDSRSANDGDKT